MGWGWLGVFGGLVAAAGVALGVWRRRVALAELARGLGALGDDRPVRPVMAGVGGGVGRLVRRFNAVVPRLEARIARLEQERHQLRAVLTGMAEGVIAIDGRRRLLFANAAADRLFGLDAAAVGRLVQELIRSPGVQRGVEATLTGTGPYRGEVGVTDRGAPPQAPAERILAVQGTPLPGSPPSGAVLVFHDITELRRLEGMRQDFVANVSHELKTPLASIKAHTETLLDWALHDEEVNVRFLQQIDEQADRLNRLIQDLLSLARLESGHESFDHGPLPLAPTARRCAEAHRDRAAAKGLDYGVDLGGIDERALVLADEEAIRQILDNLIDNAIKYTPEGGRVGISGRLDPDGRVALEVADSGVGIPRDDLPRVFERFYRVDKARSRAMGGTGLGLAIVKHLAQALGGQVSVASRLGAGSTFTVRLPRHVPQGPGGDHDGTRGKPPP